MSGRRRVTRWTGGAALAAILAAACGGAAALLHPHRRALYEPTPAGCVDREFDGHGVTLRGWFCRAARERRATLVYLHGIADNRSSAAGLVQRFTRRGIDVVAYDSRAHGESGGEACTYGYYEKQDLRRVIAALEPGPVVLMGTSLGAAVALQAAVDQPRVAGVIAAEVFADLRTVVRERVPWLVPAWALDRELRSAETRGRFEVDQVSPVRAAASLAVPALLIHGDTDRDTPPEHSRQVLDALKGPKTLVLVPGAAHNEALRDPAIWARIDAWVEALLAGATASRTVQ